MSARTRRPTPAEHEQYYAKYIDLAPDGDPVATMKDQVDTVVTRFRGLPEATAGHTYAAGKWTVREVLGHLIDTERVFSYRATAFSRGDTAPLPPFDQDAWVPYGRYQQRSIAGIVDEWVAARQATVAMADALPEDAWDRTGVASGFTFTVRALLWVPPGHLNYHLHQLEDRYGLVPAAAG